ncbi:MAG: hypothetical protein ACI30W_00710 [Muribaculaceae bacterium]
MNKLLKYMMLLFVATLSLTFASCSDNDDDDPQGGASIVGKWVDGETTLTFGSDGSYREDGSLGQYRIGTYSYSAASSLLFVDVVAIEGMNSAYRQTYVVQTLTSSTLVLLYTEGDVKGRYTRK